MAKAKIPDIILMDVILPDSNGKDIVQKLQLDEDTKKIPVIFTTNTLSLDADDGCQVFEVDGQEFRAFAKPLHYRKLVSTIRKEINRSIHGGNLPPKK
jgi:DNA-binding response OmpR family regulator